MYILLGIVIGVVVGLSVSAIQAVYMIIKNRHEINRINRYLIDNFDLERYGIKQENNSDKDGG